MINQLTTYAQNREDLYLYGILHDVTDGFYVDVGANHEKLHSVTRLFYDLGWRGMNIEPNTKLIKEFKRSRRRDINIQCGVSDVNGDMTFREYPNHDGLSTVSTEIMKLNAKRDIPYTEYQIPVKTLADIFKENEVTTIDFLKVDIEGHELHALIGNNWTRYRPKVVLFEGTRGKQCIKYMKEQDYRLEFFDGLNYYMIDNKYKKLTIHDYAGAVLAKGLYTYREVQLEAAIIRLEKDISETSAKQLEVLQEAIESGVGIRGSLKSLKASLRTKVNKRLSVRKTGE